MVYEKSVRGSGETGLMIIIAIITTIESKKKALLTVDCRKNKKNEAAVCPFRLECRGKE